ncbi:MAG: hypothetical protein R2752_05295 [Vicinamibacterales bacterium]
MPAREAIRRRVTTWAAALVLGVASPALAQVGYTGSLHFVRVGTGEDRTDAVYLFNGVEVERGRIRVSATVPVILLRAPAVDAVTGATLPAAWSNGIGDPVFRVDVATMPTRDQPFGATLSASFKPPLADAAQGFGSGEADVAFGVTLSGVRGRNSVLVDVSWWVLGDPPDLPLRDVPSFYAGYGRILDRQYRWSLLASVSGSPAIVSGLPSSSQVGVSLLRLFDRGSGVGVNLSLGLTDGAADVVVGTMWRVGF